MNAISQTGLTVAPTDKSTGVGLIYWCRIPIVECRHFCAGRNSCGDRLARIDRLAARREFTVWQVYRPDFRGAVFCAKLCAKAFPSAEFKMAGRPMVPVEVRKNWGIVRFHFARDERLFVIDWDCF